MRITMWRKFAFGFVVVLLFSSLGCTRQPPKKSVSHGPALSMDEIIREIEDLPANERMNRMIELQKDSRIHKTIQSADKEKQDRLSELMNKAQAATPKPVKPDQTKTEKN